MPAQPSTECVQPASELDIKSILLIDDDTELADTLKTLLEAHNFIVTTASNGADALHEILDLDFDVILCDLLMPAMPGDMFYLAVQKTRPHLINRFIFITGHSGNPRVDAFLKRADALCIFKPVQTEELIETISLVLQRDLPL